MVTCNVFINPFPPKCAKARIRESSIWSQAAAERRNGGKCPRGRSRP